MELKEIKIGDKVFTADGRVGKVIDVCKCEECQECGFCEPFVEYTDGETAHITVYDCRTEFTNFYMIGKNLFGNKISEEEMERRIAEQRERCKVEAQKLDNLRKQLWTMRERMIPDWKERKAARQTTKQESPKQGENERI